jgi:membrane fusion protein (multidrug efflux system)
MNCKSLLFLLLAGSLFFAACKQAPPPQHTAIPVNLFIVKSQKVVYFDRYPGTTVALSQVNLLPQVPGYITAILFKEGSHVKEGEQLYQIDKRLYQANYEAAQANLKAAKDNLTQAQQDAERYTYLNQKDAVAKQTYDHAIIALQVAKDQEQSSEEALKTAQTNLSYSDITAPFSGTIGISMVRLGDYVTVGQTVLNTISTDDPMGVDFLVNEKQLMHFEDIQDSKTKNVDSLFTILLPNGTLYSQIGKLDIIDRAVDPQTGAIRIRLMFANPDFHLRAGMSCVVRVHNQDSVPQMVVPNKAIVEQMGEFFVYVAKDTALANPADTTKGHHEAPSQTGLYAFQKKVQLGATIGPNVIVKNGINDGDKIVSDGVQSLHNGSQINP